MGNIPDYDIYNLRMRKSLIDKAFFVDKIDATVLVDFGCGDGSLLKLIKELFPEIDMIGYDNDPEMIRRAGTTPGIRFTDDWSEIEANIDHIRLHGGKSAIICNSLIHEVYAYGNTTSVAEFWTKVVNSDFDFICIRDMVRPVVFNPAPKPGEFPIMYYDPSSNSNIVSHVRRICSGQPDLHRRMVEFEERWGTIERQVNLTHFMMKYRYVENWKHELQEDYFPVDQWEIMRQFPIDSYETAYSDFSPLPFNVRQIRKDFGFTFDFPTHLKLVLEKRESHWSPDTANDP